MDGWTTGKEANSPSILPLYLGLFLALLAFFIMFTGLSIPDGNWKTAHGGGGRMHSDERDLESQDASATAGSDPDAIALASVAAAFHSLGATLMGVAADDAAAGLDVNLSTRSLFADGATTVQAAAVAVLDRTATALAAPRGDSRLVLQATFARGQGSDDEATAVRRAAGLAAALVHRGAPPEAFVAGIAPLVSGDVHLRFRLIGSNDDLVASF